MVNKELISIRKEIFTYRKEIFICRIVLIVIFFGAFTCDSLLHHDYEKFFDKSKEIESLERDIIKLEDESAKKREIMRSCFKGDNR